MIGYLSRLASQSGMKIGRTPNSPRPTASSLAPASAVEFIEQNVQTETSPVAPQPTSAANADERTIRSATENLPAGSAEAFGDFSPVDASDPHAGRDAPEIEVSPFSARPEHESERLDPSVRSMPVIPSTPSPDPAAPEPTATEVIQEVMAWIASDTTPAGTVPTESPESGNRSSLPMSKASLPLEVNAVNSTKPSDTGGPTVLPSAFRPATREPDAGSTSVHIGSIHLTIDALPERPRPPADNSPRVSSTPVPAAAPVTVGSRLRRHYLRPC